MLKPSRQWVIPALFLAMLAMFFWGLGSIPLLSFNEARRALPVREMLESGNWLIPTLNGQLYISKPPLLYWLAEIPAQLFGSTSEWVVRLPSALAASLITALSFIFMRRRFGLIPAVFTVLILLTSAGFAAFSRRAEIEMLLSACCFCSLLAAAEYIFGRQKKFWLDVAYFCLGLGLLAKGPVALLFFIPPLLGLWWRFRLPEVMTVFKYWRGWLIMLAVAIPWYLAVSLQLGWDIWSRVVETDIADKVGKAKTDPLYQYPLWLLADFLPWCLIALTSPVKNFRRWLDEPQSCLFLMASFIPLVIFSLFANKHAKYLLPSYPAWAALLALAASEFYSGLEQRWKQRFHFAVALLVLGFLAYFAAGEARLLKHRYTAFPKISAALAQYPGLPLYVLESVDPRTVYYLGKSVPIIVADKLESQVKTEGFLLLVEDKVPEQVTSRLCQLAEIKPYLRKGHKISLFGAGKACPVRP